MNTQRFADPWAMSSASGGIAYLSVDGVAVYKIESRGQEEKEGDL